MDDQDPEKKQEMQTKFMIMVVALVVCLCILFFILVKCMGNRPIFTKLKNMAKK